jgi:hypothetical protein
MGRKPVSYSFDWPKLLTALHRVLLISYNPLTYRSNLLLCNSSLKQDGKAIEPINCCDF